MIFGVCQPTLLLSLICWSVWLMWDILNGNFFVFDLIWFDNYVLFLSIYHVRQLKVWTKKPNALQQIFLSYPDISLEEEMHSLGCNFQFFVIPKDPNNTLLDVIFLRYFKCFCNEALVTFLCSWYCNHVSYSIIKVVFFFFFLV